MQQVTHSSAWPSAVLKCAVGALRAERRCVSQQGMETSSLVMSQMAQQLEISLLPPPNGGLDRESNRYQVE